MGEVEHSIFQRQRIHSGSLLKPKVKLSLMATSELDKQSDILRLISTTWPVNSLFIYSKFEDSNDY